MNRSRLRTTTVATITGTTALAQPPGNVFLPAGTAGRDRDVVVGVGQALTVDRALHLDGRMAGELSVPFLEAVDAASPWFFRFAHAVARTKGWCRPPRPMSCL